MIINTPNNTDLTQRARDLWAHIERHQLATAYLEALITLRLGPVALQRYRALLISAYELEELHTATAAQRIQAAEQVLAAHGIALP